MVGTGKARSRVLPRLDAALAGEYELILIDHCMRRCLVTQAAGCIRSSSPEEWRAIMRGASTDQALDQIVQKEWLQHLNKRFTTNELVEVPQG